MSIVSTSVRFRPRLSSGLTAFIVSVSATFPLRSYRVRIRPLSAAKPRRVFPPCLRGPLRPGEFVSAAGEFVSAAFVLRSYRVRSARIRPLSSAKPRRVFPPFLPRPRGFVSRGFVSAAFAVRFNRVHSSSVASAAFVPLSRPHSPVSAARPVRPPIPLLSRLSIGKVSYFAV